MATIYIDDKPYSVADGQNLLSACLSLGFDIPYFCWHPALGSVGACRQCAVKQYRDEQDKQGRIVMSCMTPAADGTRISIDDPEVRAFRSAVIEWLMLNHPHDCPVCDEGGECHLQDMTVMTGHNYRRSRFKKRTHRNQYLGPFIHHEMNRCIQCYRCLRFYRNFAGGRDFNVFAPHDHVYFGRHREGALANAFSGNLVEICPTGVFTDKTFKSHYTRKWDLQSAPSICVHCGLGCNTLADERYGSLRRIRNRYHHQVNGYFLCDRGRFGYEFVYSEKRIRNPLRRSEGGGQAEAVSREAALEAAAALLAESRGVIGIGSPRASLEANFMLRQLVGAERFYAGVADAELDRIRTVLSVVRKGPVRVPPVQEAADADVVFVLGEDVYNTAPLLALFLRQLVHRKACRTALEARIPGWDDAAVREVVQHEKEMLFIAAAGDTFLDDVAMATWHGTVDELARLGFAVAAALDPAAPAPPDVGGELGRLAETIAQALRDAQFPLIVSGTGCGSRALIEAAANVAYAAGSAGRPAGLLYAVPECNTLGLGLLNPSGGLESAAAALEEGDCDTLIILENDLFRRLPAERVERMLKRACQVLVLDQVHNRTTARADLLLPAAPFAEAIGTLVSNEGRAQRFFAVYPPPAQVAESWRWLQALMAAARHPEAERLRSYDAIFAALTASDPVFRKLPEAAPSGRLFRETGGRVPRQSPRFSGRTAALAHLGVHEPKPPEDPESPLAYSMEGFAGRVPPALIPRYWHPGWNSVQALNKFQSEICGPLQGGDSGVRLLAAGAVADYHPWRPAQASLPQDLRPVLPLYHVFGSEELSGLSPAIAERVPQPYLALNPADAAALGACPGDRMIVGVNGRRFELPLKILPELPTATAGLPIGIAGMPVVELPAAAAVARGKKE